MEKLRAGQQAPNFTALDITGKKVQLSSYKDGHVLVVFLRYAGCPWCNLAMHRLAMESPILKKNGCSVIAFVQSSRENIIENIQERHAVKPLFPIIADPESLIYKQYGVGRSFKAAVGTIRKIPDWVHAVKDHGFAQGKIDGELFLAPAIFLVESKSQTIVKALYGKSFYDHQTFTPIYESLIFSEPV